MKALAKLSLMALAAFSLALVACSKDQMLNPSASEGTPTKSSLQKAPPRSQSKIQMAR